MGLVFGEFAVGQRYVTPGRTITEADIVAYSALTGDYNPVHTDADLDAMQAELQAAAPGSFVARDGQTVTFAAKRALAPVGSL